MALPEDQSNWPIDAPAETESFNDNMLVGGYNPDASVQGKKQRKFTLLQLRLWFSTVLVFLNGIRFNSEIALREWISNPILASDWYTIATLGLGAGLPSSCRLVSTFGNGSIVLEISKAGLEQFIEIINITGKGSSNTILGARISTDDTSLGTIIQVNVLTNSTTLPLLTQIFSSGRALSGVASERFKLVEPVASELLPGGGTSSTFLEAGAELSFFNDVLFCPNIQGLKAVGNDDQIRVFVQWGKTPKQGTILSINPSVSGMAFYQGDGTSTAITGFTTSALTFLEDDLVSFRIDKIGIAAGLTANVPLFFRANGANGSFVIS